MPVRRSASHHLRAIALAASILIVAVTLLVAPRALANPGETSASEAAPAPEMQLTATGESAELTAAADGEDYTGGTIPILRITFRDEIDPDTGAVTVTGDEKIDLMNESPWHEYKATGVSVDLIVPPDYDNPEQDLRDGVSGYTGESNLELEFMRGRGNSSWRAAKKPYKLKFESEVDLFGMGSNKHWALIANAYDESLTIDRMVGWLGEQMGFPFTPRGVPVDLIMNGRYFGSYLLCEEVRVDKNRVDIDEVDPAAGDPDSLDITGDYLIGFSRKPTAVNYEWFETSRHNVFSYDTPEYGPEPTAVEQAQQAYLLSHLNRLEDAIYGENLTSESGENLWDLMDMRTAADYWLVQEFTGNEDAYSTPSTYVYKVRDQLAPDGTVTTGKLYWGPLWDFDFVWGDLKPEGFDRTEKVWTALMRQDPEFVALLEERWTVLDAALQELTRKGGIIDAYIVEMTDSWNANQVRWNVQGRPFDWDDSSCEACMEELRSHIEARRAWFNAHLEELQTHFYTVDFVLDGEVVQHDMAQVGQPIWVNAPEAPERDGMLFDGWLTDDGEEYENAKGYSQDMTFTARYTDASTVTQGTGIFFAQDEVWVRFGGSIAFDVLPADARDQRIEWTSSDESVVTVRDGYVIAQADSFGPDGTAEATVTARLVGSGAEASIRVVVHSSAVSIPQPESIEFSPEASLKVGEMLQLEYAAQPTPNALNVDFDLEFEVADDGVATVSPCGVLTGVGPGTTTVTVKRLNPDTREPEFVGTVEVTVEAAPEPEPQPGPEPEPSPAPAPAPDERETFSIVFDLGGGVLNGSTEPLRLQCKDGDVITIPPAPERAGYKFLYWKGSEYYPGDSYTVVGDHTFTAEWAENGAAPDKRGSTPVAPGKGSAMPRTGDPLAPVAALLAFAAAVACCALALRVSRARKR